MLGTLDLSLLALYLCAVLAAGWAGARGRRKGTEDYLLAGRRLSLPMFVATLVPSFYGGALGVGEYAWRYGVSNWLAQGVPYYVFALLYSLFLAGRIRVQPGMSMPDHLERAYGRSSAVLGALLVFLLASPADEILMLGVLARWATGWPLGLCLVLITAAAVSFLFKGGLRADVWANRLEFVVMFGGFALILPFAVKAAGGLSAFADLPATHRSAHGGQGWAYLVSWFFIALWTFVDPAFHQRVCAAKDPRTARLGIAVSVLFWMCFDAMTTTAGLYARLLAPDLHEPIFAYPTLASRVLPAGVQGLFLAGVASSTLAALQSTSLLAAASLGRDAFGRALRIAPGREEAWVRGGLVAASALGALLAWRLPSVVDLWYTLGSTVIPALLLPVLGCYFAPLRLGPRGAFACLLAGFLGGLAAWAMGSRMPFYPALGAAAAVWVLGRLAGSRG